MREYVALYTISTKKLEFGEFIPHIEKEYSRFKANNDKAAKQIAKKTSEDIKNAQRGIAHVTLDSLLEVKEIDIG